MKLIDKSALVAEIEKWISGWTERLNNTNPSNPSFFEGGIEMGKHIRSFIDTLEVKEVDLYEEITIAMPHRYSWSGDGTTMLYTEEQMKDFAKHFFELGLKAQKGE